MDKKVNQEYNNKRSTIVQGNQQEIVLDRTHQAETNIILEKKYQNIINNQIDSILFIFLYILWE